MGITKFLTGVLIILIMIGMANEIFKKKENLDCYENICVETNLDQFKSCRKLGHESTGFLSSEVFWECDGIKMPKHCTEWKEVLSNKSNSFPMMMFYTRCEEKE